MLLAACLLAAKPSRSTLDPKKGYKTKTGSTSSVTLTITQIPTPPSPLAGHPPDPRPDTPPTPGLTPPPDPRLDPPPPDPRLDPPPTAPPPPLQVLTDSWGGVASGPVVVAPPGVADRCWHIICFTNKDSKPFQGFLSRLTELFCVD